MLPFSSFFTQVPLIILAAAYMLYFGAYAIGKSKESVSDNQPEPKEQSVIINPASVPGNTYYFHNTTEISQNASVPSKNNVTYLRSYISVRYFDPDRIVHSGFITYSLFSRPPPFIG